MSGRSKNFWIQSPPEPELTGFTPTTIPSSERRPFRTAHRFPAHGTKDKMKRKNKAKTAAYKQSKIIIGWAVIQNGGIDSSGVFQPPPCSERGNVKAAF